MKNWIFAAAVAMSLATAPACAADLPEALDAPVSVPSFTWTGAYAGVNAGWGFDAGQNLNVYPGANIGLYNFYDRGQIPKPYKPRADGFIGGVQAGYNYQFNRTPLVVGVEADIQYSDMKGAKKIVLDFNFNSISRNSIETNWFGTVRGRIGLTPVERGLVYVTGGLAYADIDLRHQGTYGSLSARGASDGMQYGWTLGGGVEYALTNTVSLKAEYLHYDLGAVNLRATVRRPIGTGFVTSRVALDGDIGRVGLNYKF